jgi:hypothetical protein
MSKPDILIGLPEDLHVAMQEGGITSVGAICMQIGDRESLTPQVAERMGLQWRKFVQDYPDKVFDISVGGYDDDPRSSFAFLCVCGVFGERIKATVLSNSEIDK